MYCSVGAKLEDEAQDRTCGGTRGCGNIMPRLAGALSHKAGKKPSLKKHFSAYSCQLMSAILWAG
jgi:hypothetical protein